VIEPVPLARESSVLLTTYRTPALRNPNSSFLNSECSLYSGGTYAPISSRMLSPESPLDETITEKLLGDNAGPKDYDESEASQSREHESRWRFLAVASSSLLVVSLVFNGVLFYKNLHRGVDVDRPYIFCEDLRLNGASFC
jgi:hypothetical protein